jgi:ABC-type oligopeptide transport system ATPase subunit
MDVKIPLLEVKDLNAVFPSGEKLVRAVNDVSFTLNEGEILGIVGESGAERARCY